MVTRSSTITAPAKAFTFLDENANTIEDGVYLLFLPPSSIWQNAPSDRHNQGANLAFVDGHAEHWHWLWPKQVRAIGQPVANSADAQDLARLQSDLVSW